MKWTLEEVAKITNGTATGAADIDSVTTDSRAVPTGGLFVAIKGEHFDGHDFVDAALAEGASAVLVSAAVAGEPRVQVSDTLVGLRLLAADRRQALSTARSVGITGSTGKTSCKDLLASALGVGTWASPRSFNNEVGVPMTVLGAPDKTEVLVLEVGSRGIGHITELMDVVRPDVAVITSVSASHLATLGDVDTVRRAKWELVEGLSPDGVAVLPSADPTLLAWAKRDGQTMTSFGTDGDVQVANLRLDDLARPTFTLRADGDEVGVRLPMAGAHQAMNAAAATAAGLALGRALPDLAAGLELAQASAWRMEISSGAHTVVNDAYNANPASMAAALEATVAIPGRPIAVLGLMAELGEAAPAAHRAVGEQARQLGFAAVIVVGEDPGIADGAGDLAHPVADVAAARRKIDELVLDGDVVLVKASREVGLEALAKELVA
ncbi:MAG: UDP-N-acetylmuramoyl-tripeptide--D-alanyl-D-alanine ligase [Acidimicrobiia bacterium]|nr:UDP-N-acetylmuramoyl-tripeptide--D-alanyl-D-alanine ligase [Acidimicrobiia bacterium]